MRFTQSWLAVGAIVVTMTLPNPSWAKSSVNARISRLEAIVENQLNASLSNQLNDMQQEIYELRGKLEEQEHALRNLAFAKTISVTPGNSLPIDETAAAPGVEGDNSTVTQITEPYNEVLNDPISAINLDSEEVALERTEKNVYDLAYRYMNNKNYVQAITEYKDQLWQYPEGAYAPNAYYWLGEIYFTQWQLNKSDSVLLAQAKEAFNTVLDKYPEHHKAVDALLKLGFIELDQENWLEAKTHLNKVIKNHPGSSRARLAEARLQRMQQEGR